jgi:hypothetical protein
MKIPTRQFKVQLLQLWEPVVDGFLLHNGRSVAPEVGSVQPSHWQGEIYEPRVEDVTRKGLGGGASGTRLKSCW